MAISESINKGLKKAGVFLKGEAATMVEDFIYRECKIAAETQRYNDIIISVISLSDVGVKEQELYELLSKFWNIDSRKDATEYINIGRHLEWPYIRLKLFLEKQGYDGMEIIRYMRENNVRQKLKLNPKLCEVSDEKLKAALEKIKLE